MRLIRAIDKVPKAIKILLFVQFSTVKVVGELVGKEIGQSLVQKYILILFTSFMSFQLPSGLLKLKRNPKKSKSSILAYLTTLSLLQSFG